jgi:hypothetical protein
VKRREFITLLGGGAAVWPLAARAQQPKKLPTIGFLGPNTPSLDSRRVGAFVQRLRELGWIEGRNVAPARSRDALSTAALFIDGPTTPTAARLRAWAAGRSLRVIGRVGEGWRPLSPWISIQNNSGLPKDFLPTLHGSLSLQQPAAGTVGRLVAIAGAAGPKAGEKPRARHRTARVHHASRRRGGGVATCGTRAAA